MHHRYERARKRSRRQLDFDAADSLIVLHESANAEPSENLPRCEPLLDEVDGDTGITTQTEMTGGLIEAMSSEINNLTSEIAQTKSQLAKQEMSEHFFKFDDDKVRFYTGLQTYQILMLIFGFIQPHIYVNARSALTSFQQVIMTLMKLRLNLPVQDLAYRFGTSTSTISRVFTLVIDVMYKRLHFLLRWPTREELRSTMPMEFRTHFGTKVAVIIDCFEIFIDRPSNLKAQAQTWSNYKHHNTIKFLIGISPQGTIVFISKAWGGRVSDTFLTESCGFLNNILPGDLILADRGFDIGDSVGLMCAEVKTPAFMKGRKQLSMTDIVKTRDIARVRIHVERVIGCIRQRYTMLGGPVPIDHLLTKDIDGITLMDKIVEVCCDLNNVCDTVIPFD